MVILEPVTTPDRELRLLRQISSRLPAVPHVSGVVNRIIKPWYLRKPRPEVLASVHGVQMRLKPHEAIDGAYLFYPHLYDREEIAFLRRMLRPGGTFVDVGAHIGFYSLIAAKQVGSGGLVVSIEPEADSFERLVWNAETNDMSQVHPVRRGVAPTAQTRRLAVQRLGNRGGSSFRAHSLEVQDVECEPLLDILRRHEVEHVDGMKLDIEGDEVEVLTSFFACASPPLRPEFLIVEDAEWTQAETSLVRAMRTSGYHLHSRHLGNAVNCVFVKA